MKIAVLISGGVDSSVALRLLKEQGHDITAFYLKIWLEDELSFLGTCPWEEDLAYVRAVCEQIQVPLEVISLQQEYWDEVVQYTIAEVKAGRTPNPDMLCNQRIKFGAFLKKIDDSFDKVATGHYAQVMIQDGLAQLHTSPDLIKDQTYFLAHLNQQQVARSLFPIGHLDKKQVRALAHEFNLPTKERKDSQGICFLGKLKFSEFLKFHLGERTGNLIEYETGTIVGQHPGFWYYTHGQRQGLGLAGGPWYVVSKNPDANIVYISRQYYTPEKSRDSFEVGSLHWISGTKPNVSHLSVKIRHGQQLYPCTIDFDENNHAVVRLNDHDQGIAPGQFAVFYEGDHCLGTGVIQRSLR